VISEEFFTFVMDVEVLVRAKGTRGASRGGSEVSVSVGFRFLDALLLAVSIGLGGCVGTAEGGDGDGDNEDGNGDEDGNAERIVCGSVVVSFEDLLSGAIFTKSS
jgi:hypothetical protein